MSMIRRLEKNGESQSELADIHCKHITIKSILKNAASVWQARLTLENKADIEMVQQSALAIILSKRYIRYSNVLATLKLESLRVKRE